MLRGTYQNATMMCILSGQLQCIVIPAGNPVLTSPSYQSEHVPHYIIDNDGWDYDPKAVWQVHKVWVLLLCVQGY